MVIPASVVVVSRHRTDALLRCLRGLTQQDHPAFEVIVVADPKAAKAAQDLGLGLKLCVFDEANISQARNHGLQMAAADIVAFIDDDAVPEPTWLSRLTAPFADAKVTAATGFVRGRNGISFQWRAAEVDRFGIDHPFDMTMEPQVFAAKAGRVIKTQGTNCAFRRADLAAIGGFDPAYRFYFDETDVNMRLGVHGLTAVVPLAQVHHGFAESVYRTANRVPTSLHEIGASTAVFLRRHADAADLEQGRARLWAEQSQRLARMTKSHGLQHSATVALLETLAAGWAEGLDRPLGELVALAPSVSPFAPIAGTGLRAGRVIAGRFWQKRALIGQAKAALANNEIPTVFCFSPSFRAHQMTYDPAGFWIQQGGLFGRSDRSAALFQPWTFRRRIVAEVARLGVVRPLKHT